MGGRSVSLQRVIARAPSLTRAHGRQNDGDGLFARRRTQFDK